MSMLDSNGKFASLHTPPFNREHRTGQEATERYKWGFITHGGAYITFVVAGLELRPFLATFDGMPNFTSVQLALKSGGYSCPVIIGASFNKHDTKVRMPKEDYQKAFWKVQSLCGEASGPVADQIDHTLLARANAGLRPGEGFDISDQAGDNVGRIVHPCLMFAPQVYTKGYEPWEYGLDLTPRYWDYKEGKMFVPPGHETKGELMERTAPYGRTCGMDFADVIIGTTFEKNRLVMFGWMPLKEYYEKAVVIPMEFETGKVADRLIMPYAATCWRPMIEYFKLLKGCDEAVAAGLLILGK